MTTEVLEPMPSEPLPPRRKIALPIALAAIGAALVVAIVVIVGLSALEPTGPSGATSTATTAPTSPAPNPSEVAPRPEAQENQCVDALGDAATVDLDTVTVAEDDGELVVEFTLVDELPAGQSSLGLVVSSRNEKTNYLLAVTWQGDSITEFFAYKFAEGSKGRDRADPGETDDLDTDDVAVNGSVISMRFPEYIIDDLSKNWQWSAFSIVNSVDADACPGEIGSGETLTFTSS